ncbi:LysR family transcriptional regulator [Shewanella sp. Isolate11]|uniref:LysR family transcriptional regulator n=1 Tax=Shewanella sp. Isolate11 TaxID=2908530 RepID=UPI001EFD4A9B|nr:LysR family transcriptional regulator [Shewanella sp. Isolate11]MCG9695669.1 LysR family transcriptional regulator [Shewanella sp. Isolate11]
MLKKASRLDYFTLHVFIGLIELKSGSAVAERLRTPQSKVSRALTCMREVLDNELFIRHQYGFEPTQLALKLYPMVQKILEQYSQIIDTALNRAPLPFQLSIATYEHWSLIVLNGINQTCHCIEGGININVLPWTENTPLRLSQGLINCCISTQLIEHPMVNNIKLDDIDHFFIVAKKGHPIFNSPQPMTELFNYPIGLINTQHSDHLHPLEHFAAENNIKFKVGIKSPSLRMLVDHASKTDDVCMLCSVMSLPYFQHREDVEFIDISALCQHHLSLPQNSYYLHCHQGLKEQLVQCIAGLLKDKITEVKQQYQASKQSTANARSVESITASLATTS